MEDNTIFGIIQQSLAILEKEVGKVVNNPVPLTPSFIDDVNKKHYNVYTKQI